MISNNNGGNGGAEAQLGRGGEVITIVLTRNPWSVQLAAPGTEPEATLAALRTAVDLLETQVRLQRMKSAVENAAEFARVQKVLARGQGDRGGSD